MSFSRIALLGIILAATSAQTGAQFATTVVSSTNLVGTGLYNDPSAALGKPTLEYVDNFEGRTYRPSLVSGAFNTTPGNAKTLVTIAPGSSLVLGFDAPVIDDPLNPFGLDLIVFGNSFFSALDPVTPTANLEAVRVGVLFAEPGVNVEVAQSASGPWSLLSGPADGLFPTQSYRWDRALDTWAGESDFTRPVNPSLTTADFVGKSVADGIDLYGGSGGGTGYDIADTGLGWVQYVRFSSLGPTWSGEIDAVSDVTAVPEPTAVGLAGIAVAVLLRRRPNA